MKINGEREMEGRGISMKIDGNRHSSYIRLVP
jgi:hypothetical protein